MVEKEAMDLQQALLRRPIAWDPVPPWIIIHWDPIPPWLKVNDKIMHQFAQMEFKFREMELDILQRKLQELRKIIGGPSG